MRQAVTYDRFLLSYAVDQGSVLQSFEMAKFESVEGLKELTTQLGGMSFGGGIVHVHSESQMRRAVDLVRKEFPEYRNEVVPFAKDWIGRQFAVSVSPDDSLGLLLFEPGSGEVFEIDSSIPRLFNGEFSADPETFLASDLFVEWVADRALPSSASQCVGFKVPIFLGGAGSVDNLEIVDEEVYWSIFGQLRIEANRLPPGTVIDGLHIN